MTSSDPVVRRAMKDFRKRASKLEGRADRHHERLVSLERSYNHLLTLLKKDLQR